jgi:hypothetical protein
MFHHFEILNERRKEYRLFNATGTQLTVRLKPPPTDSDSESSSTPFNPITHFMASLDELFDYALQNLEDNDKVGISIRNEANQTKI